MLSARTDKAKQKVISKIKDEVEKKTEKSGMTKKQKDSDDDESYNKKKK